MRRSKTVRVVVAGAGLAGLAAARHLEAAGVEVTVLEALLRGVNLQGDVAGFLIDLVQSRGRCIHGR
jgi:flavin-dependent dehydrogenase